jgi:hypothetical protein
LQETQKAEVPEAGILPFEWRSHLNVKILQSWLLETILQGQRCSVVAPLSLRRKHESVFREHLLAGWSKPRKAGCLVINGK